MAYSSTPIQHLSITSPLNQPIVLVKGHVNAIVDSVASHITQLQMPDSTVFFADGAITENLTHLMVNGLREGSCVPETIEHLFIRNSGGSCIPPQSLPSVKNLYLHPQNIPKSNLLFPFEHSVFFWNGKVYESDLGLDKYDQVGEQIQMGVFGLNLWVARRKPKVPEPVIVAPVTETITTPPKTDLEIKLDYLQAKQAHLAKKIDSVTKKIAKA